MRNISDRLSSSLTFRSTQTNNSTCNLDQYPLWNALGNHLFVTVGDDDGLDYAFHRLLELRVKK